MARKVQDNIKAFAAKRVLDYMDKNPDENIPKVLDWLENHDRDNILTDQIKTIRSYIDSPDNNWYILLKSLWSDLDDRVRRRLFRNFVINASMLGVQQQWKSGKENNCNTPFAILMDPTSACNLHCTGCWAAEYDKSLNLSLDELDGIIRQGNALGVYFFLYSGGEPLIRKKDIIQTLRDAPGQRISLLH